MKILFAVDLTEPRSVTAYVRDLAERLSAELLVIHVEMPVRSMTATPVDPLSGIGAFSPYALYDPAVIGEIEEARRHSFDYFLKEHFPGPVRAALREGDPADVIIEDAAEFDADLIVMGKRRHPALERLLLGSVTREVVENAIRPTLLIPIEEESEEGLEMDSDESPEAGQ